MLSPIPPQIVPQKEAAISPTTEIPKLAAVPDIQPNQENTTSNATDAFDQLANAVSTSVNEENKGPSLEQLVAAPAAETTAQPIETSAPTVDPVLVSKSDEELLKEFENLLNSG